MITEQDRKWHQEYEQAPPEQQEAVNETYRAVCTVMAARGYPTYGDDRAESLIAAIYRYLSESAEAAKMRNANG